MARTLAALPCLRAFPKMCECLVRPRISRRAALTRRIGQSSSLPAEETIQRRRGKHWPSCSKHISIFFTHTRAGVVTENRTARIWSKRSVFICRKNTHSPRLINSVENFGVFSSARCKIFWPTKKRVPAHRSGAAGARSFFRDVAQRVPQRAPHGARAKVGCRKTGIDNCTSAKSKLKRLLWACRRSAHRLN
jgi:hypothetical protein